jgi:hypothetical protein
VTLKGKSSEHWTGHPYLSGLYPWAASPGHLPGHQDFLAVLGGRALPGDPTGNKSKDPERGSGCYDPCPRGLVPPSSWPPLFSIMAAPEATCRNSLEGNDRCPVGEQGQEWGLEGQDIERTPPTPTQAVVCERSCQEILHSVENPPPWISC